MDGHARRRILLVDDDPEINTTLEDGLRLLGDFDVAAATDGATGLERAHELMPDCIIVDVRMPGLNGYQMVRALRGDPATSAIPIILLSALAQEREQLAGLLTGADAYLLKPVTLDDLLRVIQEAMDLSSHDRQTRGGLLAGESAQSQGDGV